MASISEKKLVRSKSGLRIVSCYENGRSPFELSEPPWIPDNECFQCMHCLMRFDLLKRRHHCRRCGRIFCSGCCDEKVALPRMCFVDPVRMCASCVDTTRKENEFYDRHLKTLTNGAFFELSGSQFTNRESNVTNSYICKLSADHRQIVFEGDGPDCPLRQPLEVEQIQNAKVIRPQLEDYQDNGTAAATGLCISYGRYRNDPSSTITLTIGTAGTNKLQSAAWISAILKAIKMMFESRGPTNP